MKTTRLTSFSALLLVLLLVVLAGTHATAGNLRLILMVDKANYESLSKVVGDLKGTVNFKYKYSNAIAVSIPAEKMAALASRPEVQKVLKDEVVSLPFPRRREVPGRGAFPPLYTTDAAQSKALTTTELQSMLSDRQTNYYPYENKLTHAFEFSAATNHFGENVIVAVIDAGVSRDAIAVAGSDGSRIVGAENFTTDGIPADSKLNGSHGTWVACCIGANAVFGFPNTSAFLQAIKAYVPGAVIPDLFAPGVDGVPMVGQAPLVKFYALKVFPAGANSTSRSIIAAALERAIELKENFNSGGSDAANIQVVNMSLGGANLFAGNDPLYAPLVAEAQHAGIVLTVSSGNDGPAGLTIGTPGDSKGILSVGATSDAVHGRVVGDLLLAPGLGAFYRPVDNNLVADFSSRGPTADGRMDPNIVAPGDWRYAQGADTRISLVSGTSFSAPTVAGAAALLLSAHPGATDDQIRGALLLGANGKELDDRPQKVDQGFGFLDVMAANKKFGAFNPWDLGLSTPLVRLNVLPFGITAIDGNSFSGNTGWLLPGQRKEFYLQTTSQPLTGLTIQVSVTPELPADQQNQLFGDDAEFTVATAKTSFGDYRVFEFVPGSKTFNIVEDDLDMGLTRITVTGDFTNVGRIKANVQIIKNPASLRLCPIAKGKIAQGEEQDFPLTIPAGVSAAHFELFWLNGWEAWPTNDLDVLFTDPNGNLVLSDPDADGDIDGAGLDTPERVTLTNPVAGTWTMSVLGSTVWGNKTNFTVLSDLHAPSHLAQQAGGVGETPAKEVPAEFALAQNFPNPFNPSTVIRYSLPLNVHVQLTVYNTLGQRVSVLVNEDQEAGNHQVVFQDPGLASGVYFYRLEAGNFQAMNKFVLLK